MSLDDKNLEDIAEATDAETGEETSLLKEVLNTALYVVAVLVLCFLIIRFVGQRSIVDGSSMEPLLQDGDNIWVDKITYAIDEPQRFDVVPFEFQGRENTWFIKRIIGLPGETVRIDDDGNIYINGKVLEEDYGLETIEYPGLASVEMTLGEDEYFVLGDNRNNSEDSRYPEVGAVNKDQIVGKAVFRFFPFNKIKVIKS